MFSYLRKIFRKNVPAAKTGTYMVHGVGSMPKPTPLQGSAVGVAGPMPRVETAQLQLAAIMAKFPDELRKLVLRQPAPEAMVALPLPTIQKFLPTGSVKMSLARIRSSSARTSAAGGWSATGCQNLTLMPTCSRRIAVSGIGLEIVPSFDAPIVLAASFILVRKP